MKQNHRLFILGIVLIACNMRASITGVGPLVGAIQTSLALSSFWAGMLTTIPLLAFAAVSAVVGSVSAKIGSGKVMLGGLALLAGGILLRSSGSVAGLFAGTLFIGMGIACANVLVPALIKGVFPENVHTMTSLYTTCMAIFSGISAAISVPLAARYGWQWALVVWVLPATIALGAWLPNRGIRQTPHPGGGTTNMLKSRTAIYVSVYMGVQSFMFFSFVAWLPAILAAKGFSTENAGTIFSLYQLIGIPASFITPLLARRGKDQRVLVTCITTSYLVGICSIMLSSAPAIVIIGVLLCGFCSGASLSLALMFIGLRTAHAADTAKLSGVSQSIGYLIAAVGPTLMGGFYDLAGGWFYPLLGLAGVLIVLLYFGFKAGADTKV